MDNKELLRWLCEYRKDKFQILGIVYTYGEDVKIDIY